MTPVPKGRGPPGGPGQLPGAVSPGDAGTRTCPAARGSRTAGRRSPHPAPRCGTRRGAAPRGFLRAGAQLRGTRPPRRPTAPAPRAHTHTRVRAQSDALRTRTLRNPAAFPAPPREGPPQPYGRALRGTAASAAPLTGTPKPPRAAPRAARCPRPCPARPALTCRATSAAAIAASPPQGPPRPAGRAAPDAPTAPPHGGEKPPRRSTPRAPPAP